MKKHPNHPASILAATLIAACCVTSAQALDLNGTDTTVASLNGSVTDFVTDNSATSGITTLTINGGGVSTYAGMIYDGYTRDVALFLTGNSTLSLTGVNAYSGGTTIDSGILQINNAESLGSTGGIVTINNGVLEILAAAGTLYDYHSFQLASANSTMQVDSGAVCFLYGSISDFTSPGTLNVTGPGTLFLGGSNYYSGGTILSAGTLQLGGAAALGASTSPLTVNAGTLDLQGNNITTGALAGIGGTITSTISGTIRLTVGDASTTTFSGLIQNGSATLSLAYAGSGSMTLNHVNTYTGGTTITGGTLILTSASSLGTGAVTINGGTLDIGGDPTAGDVNFGSRAITIAGAGGDGVSGAIVNNGTLNQTNAFQNVVLSANATIGGTGRFDVRGGIATLTLNNHTLTKTGANQVSLVGATVTDGSIIVNGGIFSLETSTTVHDYADGNSITYLGNTTAQFYGSTGDISRPMIFNGAGIVVGNTNVNITATVASPMTLEGDIAFAPIGGASGNLTLNGIISQSGGSHGITKTTTGILTLNGNNTFTGNTTLNAGTTVVSASGALASASISVGSGAIFTLQTGGNISTTPALTANGTVNLPTGSRTINSLNGAGSLVLNGSALNLANGGSFSGIISNGTATGSLLLAGGTLTLSGANTYSGGTTINSGALYVNNATGTGTGPGAVTLNSGTLGGSGSVGSVIAGSSAHVINPGSTGPNSVGTLTLANLSTNANTTLSFDLGSPATASDLLKVTGTLSLNGGQVAISSQASTGATSLGYYRVISYSGALTGSTSGIILPPIANNIAYTLDPTHNTGYIDIHRGFIGDANDDGTVDLNDLNIVLNNLGTTTSSWTNGNFDGATTIDLNDLNDVLNHLGVSIPSTADTVAVAQSLAGNSAPVPEPTTLGIAGLGAFAALLRRRPRGNR